MLSVPAPEKVMFALPDSVREPNMVMIPVPIFIFIEWPLVLSLRDKSPFIFIF